MGARRGFPCRVFRLVDAPFAEPRKATIGSLGGPYCFGRNTYFAFRFTGYRISWGRVYSGVRFEPAA